MRDVGVSFDNTHSSLAVNLKAFSREFLFKLSSFDISFFLEGAACFIKA